MSLRGSGAARLAHFCARIAVATSFACQTTVILPAPVQRPVERAEPDEPKNPRRVARIVTQGSVKRPYLGMIPGDRFALFLDAIVDVRNARVAWYTRAPGYLEFPAKPDHLVRECTKYDAGAPGNGQGMELWNVLNGKVVATFSGRLIAHSELNGLMPVQRGNVLTIVDTFEAREVAHVPVVGEALSAVLDSGGQLHVLSRDDLPWPRELSEEQLTLQSFQWPGAVPLAVRPLRISWREHQPKPPTEERSPPFIHTDAQGKLGITRLFRQGYREPPAPTEIYSVAVDSLNTTAPERWTERPFDYPKGQEIILLANSGARPIPRPEVSDEVRDALATLPKVAMGGSAGGAGTQLLTSGDGYLCHWSLREARRNHCVRVENDEASPLNETHVWLKKQNRHLGVWDLRSDSVQWEDLEASSIDTAPSGSRYVFTRIAPSGETLVHMRTWPNDSDDWRARCRDPEPRWDASGSLVLCDVPGKAGTRIAFDATSGKRVPRPPVDATLQQGERADLGCGLANWNDGGDPSILVGAGDQVRFVAYDLGLDEWAIALPDGRYTGSKHAAERLTFYDQHGALMSPEEAAVARDPEDVERELSSLLRCGAPQP